MNTYKVTIKVNAESKKKVALEVALRIPHGQICKVRLDNNKH